MHRSFKAIVSAVLIAAFVSVSFSACAVAQARRRVDIARLDLVGISRATLIDCAGNPDWAEERGERETVSYVIENPESEKHKRASTCVASFQLRRGYVEHLYYETLAGRMVDGREACLPIVDGCLSAVN